MNNQSKFAIFTTLFILCLFGILITLFLPFAKIEPYGCTVAGVSFLRLDEVGKQVRTTFSDYPVPLYGGAILSAFAVFLLLRKIIGFLRACYHGTFEYDSALPGFGPILALLISVAQLTDILHYHSPEFGSFTGYRTALLAIPFVPFLRVFLCVSALWLSRVLGDLVGRPFNDKEESNT